MIGFIQGLGFNHEEGVYDNPIPEPSGKQLIELKGSFGQKQDYFFRVGEMGRINLLSTYKACEETIF